MFQVGNSLPDLAAGAMPKFKRVTNQPQPISSPIIVITIIFIPALSEATPSQALKLLKFGPNLSPRMVGGTE